MLMFKLKHKAFTLVELIVVITILAILWTIAFISLQWHSQSARNSTRISDIKSLEKMFSFYELRESTYPTPSNGEEITYSWAKVWTQWTFWEETRVSIWPRWNISNVPVDPLTWAEYTYSLLNTWAEYQVAWVLEWWEATNLNLTNTSYANWAFGTTFVRWNYNRQMAKVYTWSTSYVLAIPTIIRWTTTDTDVVDIVRDNKLTYNGSRGLPWSYDWATFDDALTTSPVVDVDSMLVFEWDISTLQTNETARWDFITSLQTAYTGTVVADNDAISPIINVDAWWVEELAVTLVNGNLGGSIVASSWGSESGWDWGSSHPWDTVAGQNVTGYWYAPNLNWVWTTDWDTLTLVTWGKVLFTPNSFPFGEVESIDLSNGMNEIDLQRLVNEALNTDTTLVEFRSVQNDIKFLIPAREIADSTPFTHIQLVDDPLSTWNGSAWSSYSYTTE